MKTTSSPTTTPTDPGHTLTQAQITKASELFEFKPGMFVSHATLEQLLPDVRTTMFFAKAYRMDYRKLSELLGARFKGRAITALLNEGAMHSGDLQDYIIDTASSYVEVVRGVDDEDPEPPPDTEVLSQLIEEAAVEVAQSISDVADKLALVLDSLPSKYGEMTFRQLHKWNRQRSSIGTFEAQIDHKPVPPRLVVLDVSGSMSEGTVRQIVDEVVGMAYSVDASLAIVSDNAYFWEAGTFDTGDVLAKAEYNGTHYEQLTGVFDRDWETVITVADYDSAMSARDHLVKNASGRVGTVLDISLVNRTTYLAECVAGLAHELKPLLIGNSRSVMRQY